LRYDEGDFKVDRDFLKVTSPSIDQGQNFQWTLIETRYNCGDWIEEQDPAYWKIHGARHRARYWVRDELMFLLTLHWRRAK
jgi:hypothetical protein